MLRSAAPIAAALLVAGTASALPGAGSAVSGPQGLIAFASDRDGHDAIYSVRADGTLLGRLTQGGYDREDAEPQFSRDGRRLAFIRSSGDLWVSAADGIGARLLLPSDVESAGWSPDSQQILVDAFPGVRVVAAAGGPPRTILANADSGTASWSPNGTRVVVARFVPGPSESVDVVVVGSDGRGPLAVARDGDRSASERPAWSPRGDLIAFDATGGLAVVGTDGRGERRVAGSATAFAWSPDGTTLAYTEGQHLFAAPAAGGAPADLTPDGPDLGTSEGTRLAWSPDGRWIAFAHSGDLLVAAADGSGIRRIRAAYPYGGHNVGPTWRPLDHPGRLGTVPVAVAPSELASPTLLTTTGRIASLAADGPRVAVGLGTTDGDCGHPVVWKPGTSPVRIDPRSPCYFDLFGQGSYTLTGRIALAGTRVAWIGVFQNEHEERTYYLDSATAEGHTGVGVDGAGTDHESGFVSAFGGLAGSGDLLVYSRKSAPDNVSRLSRITAAGPTAIGPIDGAPVAVADGNVAVREPDGSVRVIGADGHTVRRFAFRSDSAVLEGARLVTKAGPTLTLLDVPTGGVLGTVRVKGSGSWTLVDAEGGIAVLLEGRTVHVVRLADGRATRFAPGGRGAVFAQLEARGLFVGYSLARGLLRPGRVDFVARARLDRRLDS